MMQRQDRKNKCNGHTCQSVTIIKCRGGCCTTTNSNALQRHQQRPLNGTTTLLTSAGGYAFLCFANLVRETSRLPLRSLSKRRLSIEKYVHHECHATSVVQNRAGFPIKKQLTLPRGFLCWPKKAFVRAASVNDRLDFIKRSVGRRSPSK